MHLFNEIVWGALGAFAAFLLVRAGRRAWRLFRLAGRLDDWAVADTRPPARPPRRGAGGPEGWVRWVLDGFPEDAAAARFTREEALGTLDDLLAADVDDQILRRSAVLAPLVGVLVTVGRLWLVPIDVAAGGDVGTVLARIAVPLYAGVAVGAVGAIWCQVLLGVVWAAGRAVRRAGVGWFDRVVWGRLPAIGSGADARLQAGADVLAGALGRAADTIGETAGGLRDIVADVRESVQHLRDAAGQQQAAVAAAVAPLQNLGADLASAVGQLVKAVDPVGRLATEVSGHFARIGRAGARIRQASHQFETAVSGPLHTAVESFGRAATEMSGLADRLNAHSTEVTAATGGVAAAAAHMGEAVGDLRTGAEAQRAAAADLRASVTDDLLPAHRALGGAADRFTASSGRLAGFVTDGLGPATEQLAGLGDLLADHQRYLTGLVNVVEVGRGVEPLLAALARGADAARGAADLPDLVRAAVRHLQDEVTESARRAADTLAPVAAALAGLPAAVEGLAATARHLDETGRTALTAGTTAAEQVVAAAGAFGEAVGAVPTSARQLSEAAGRLASAGETLAGAGGGAVAVVTGLPAAVDESISRLTAKLDQVTKRLVEYHRDRMLELVTDLVKNTAYAGGGGR